MHPLSHEDKVRTVFGERAATYTTSASHTDPEVLAEARGLQAGNGLRNVSLAVADAHRLPFAAVRA